GKGARYAPAGGARGGGGAGRGGGGGGAPRGCGPASDPVGDRRPPTDGSLPQAGSGLSLPTARSQAEGVRFIVGMEGPCNGSAGMTGMPLRCGGFRGTLAGR